jgi:hypothetical protein
VPLFIGDGSLVDLDRRALVSNPAIEPHQARSSGWNEREKGVFAVRGDGFQVATADSGASRRGDIPKGPLRWRRAPAPR